MVDPIYMFNLAAQHARWATVRQAVITGNIANANTPGYDALDVQPFSAVLDTAGLAMAETAPGHINVSGDDSGDAAPNDWDVSSSGAPVALDREMMKADETNRAFALDTSVVRAFHRMLLASVRSGA